MNVNAYLGRQYERPPCWQLVTDVLQTELGARVAAFRARHGGVRAAAEAFRLALHRDPEGLKRIDNPEDLCIVLLGKAKHLGLHHCGIWWQGSVLHALENGVLYQDRASIGDAYPLIEYWAVA